jgi:hypothetical protein
VSNNCVAGILYEIAGLQKHSPTAGLYFTREAYPRFLEDIAGEGWEAWGHLDPEKLRFRPSQACWELPIPPSGELVFLHYPDKLGAVSKWNRRMERLRGRTPLIVSSIQNGTTLDHLREPLTRFRYSFTADGNPAPDADLLVLRRDFLRDLSNFIRLIVSNDQSAIGDPHPVRRYE